MTRVWGFLFSLSLFSATFAASKKDRALLIVESDAIKLTHVLLIRNLFMQFEVTMKHADDPELQFLKYGIKMYQHIFVLAPSTEVFGGDIKSKSKRLFSIVPKKYKK